MKSRELLLTQHTNNVLHNSVLHFFTGQSKAMMSNRGMLSYVQSIYQGYFSCLGAAVGLKLQIYISSYLRTWCYHVCFFALNSCLS